jgi:hypothetical protein
LGDAGVVDQYVDTAEVLHDLSHRAFDLRFVGHVGSQTEVAFAQRRRCITRSSFVQIEDDHAGAVLGECDRGGAADTAFGCSTGDDCNFALKQHEKDL